jgi:DNA invertase Pin-like site-specific DNA recombinase
MFQVVGALAEFEKALIQERVRCELKNARAKGQRLGRPRRVESHDQILRLKAQGASLREIAATLGVGYGAIRTRLAAGELKPLPPEPPQGTHSKELPWRFR